LIRRASAADTTGILLCLGAAFLEFRGDYTPEGFADTVLSEARIQKRLREMTVLVAEEGGVVGTIACVRHGDEGHLRGMAVLPVWRGRGLAEQLLAAAEAELAGCTRITLDTTAPLRRAIRFYEKHGYRATGRVSDFFGMPLYEYEKALRR
jgi:ribosomal protein S18 acetylase RimI-like enzyme